jgi:diguanylate cyclase (GGDEF)-like protein
MHALTSIRQSPRTLLLTAAAVPVAGWTVHALYLHRALAHASRDPLTGVLRRDAFTRSAQRLVARHGDDVLVAVIDLDHFKDLNDSRGHAAGDQALADVGLRLQLWTGLGAVAGRLGGDEFALVLPCPTARHAWEAAHLGATLNTPVRINGQLVDVPASVGVATPALLPGVRTLSGLLRAADAAMYAGKHTGRPVMATAEHAATASVNGRRAGRPGTSQLMGAA